MLEKPNRFSTHYWKGSASSTTPVSSSSGERVWTTPIRKKQVKFSPTERETKSIIHVPVATFMLTAMFSCDQISREEKRRRTQGGKKGLGQSWKWFLPGTVEPLLSNCYRCTLKNICGSLRNWLWLLPVGIGLEMAGCIKRQWYFAPGREQQKGPSFCVNLLEGSVMSSWGINSTWNPWHFCCLFSVLLILHCTGVNEPNSGAINVSVHCNGVQVSPKDTWKCSPVHHKKKVITFILQISNRTCFISMICWELFVFWECCFSCLFSAAAAAQRGRRGDSWSKHMSSLSGVYRLKTILSVWNKEVVTTGVHGGNATINKDCAPPSKKSIG